MNNKLNIIGALSVLLCIALVIVGINWSSTSNRVKYLQNEIKLINRNSEDEKSKFEKEIADLNEIIIYKDKDLEKYKDLFNTNGTKFDALYKELDLKNKKIDELNKKIQSLEKTILDKENAIKETDKLKAKVTELEGIIKNNNSEINKLKDVIIAKESTIDELNKEINKLKDTIDAKESMIVELNKEIEKLKEQINVVE